MEIFCLHFGIEKHFLTHRHILLTATLTKFQLHCLIHELKNETCGVKCKVISKLLLGKLVKLAQ